MTGSPSAGARTRLARVRTAAGFAVLGLFLLRQGLSRSTSLDLVAAALALVCGVVCVRAFRPGEQALPVAVRRVRLLTLTVC